jgi:hypothetical protein
MPFAAVADAQSEVSVPVAGLAEGERKITKQPFFSCSFH